MNETQTEREQGLEFALQLMGASVDGLAQTTNTLIDNLTAQLEYEHARSEAVADQIERLVAGPYMPTPAAILQALWPSEATIKAFMPAKDS